MKNNQDNISSDEELQITLDAFSQTMFVVKDELSEIKGELISVKENLQNNGDSGSKSLDIDLLNKILKTIDHAKKSIDLEDLKKFTTGVLGAQIQLQEEANNTFSQFLNEKIEELNSLAKQPSITKNEYSVDFRSSKTFIAMITISITLLVSSFINYNQYQSNQNLSDNDLKYRYIKMANGIMPEDLSRLENLFHYPDSAYVLNNIRKLIEEHEYKLKIQTEKLEQVRRMEQEIEKLKEW